MVERLLILKQCAGNVFTSTAERIIFFRNRLIVKPDIYFKYLLFYKYILLCFSTSAPNLTCSLQLQCKVHFSLEWKPIHQFMDRKLTCKANIPNICYSYSFLNVSICTFSVLYHCRWNILVRQNKLFEDITSVKSITAQTN